MVNSLAIKSPKATQVKAVQADPGTEVAEGAALIDLYAWEEEKILSQLERSLAENASKSEEVKGQRIAYRLTNLTDVVRLRALAVAAAQLALQGTREEAKVGRKI